MNSDLYEVVKLFAIPYYTVKHHKKNFIKSHLPYHRPSQTVSA